MTKAAAYTVQQSFRFRNDNGTETGATWKEDLNVDWTIDADAAFRIRIMIEETAGGTSEDESKYRLWVSKNGGAYARIVAASGDLRPAASSYFVNGDHTTQQLGSDSYVSTNYGMNENEEPTNPMTLTADYQCEFEYCVKFANWAGLSDGDYFDLRIERYNVTDFELDGYNETPRVTISKFDPNLTIQDSGHAHIVDNVVLTKKTTLTIAEALHDHLADNVVLTYTAIIPNIADCDHDHLADNIDLGYTAIIPAINECLHGHLADEPVLTARVNLDVNEGTHAHYADEPAVVVAYNIAVNDGQHAHTADNLDIVSAATLVIQEATHAHAAEEPDPEVVFFLQIADSGHAHAADNLDITAHTSLEIQDSAHAHAAENVVLVSTYLLAVNDAAHGHLADSPEMQSVFIIESIADCAHGHLADNLDITSLLTLVIAETAHAHAADQCNVEIVGGPIDLEIDSARHNHTAESILDILRTVNLVVADALHDHAADSVPIGHNIRNETYPTFQHEDHPMEIHQVALLNLGRFFTVDPTTDLWISPSLNETAIHTADFLVRATGVVRPTSAGTITIEFRRVYSGSWDEIAIEVDELGTMTLLENGVPRVTGSSGDVGHLGGFWGLFRGSSGAIFGDSGLVGAYGSLTVVNGTDAKLTALDNGADLGRVEFLPRWLPANLPVEL